MMVNRGITIPLFIFICLHAHCLYGNNTIETPAVSFHAKQCRELLEKAKKTRFNILMKNGVQYTGTIAGIDTCCGVISIVDKKKGVIELAVRDIQKIRTHKSHNAVKNAVIGGIAVVGTAFLILIFYSGAGGT
jgi:hypothetical protein